MASRGHIPPSPYDGRLIQAPGMMRHGPFPGSASLSHHPLDPLPPPQLLEKKLSAQGKEMEVLMMENQRLATTHVTLRRDLLITQQEMQRVQAHRGAAQAESEIQIRNLLEKIARTEAEIHASEGVRDELRHAHMELNDLLSARQELTSQIQQASEELQKAHADVKKLPEMLIELDGLMQEHQKLRAAFEYEKGLNIDLVDKMRTMEKDLFSMMREVEKLRAEVMTVEKRAHAPNPYGAMYGGQGSGYPVAANGGQGLGFPVAGNGGDYANAAYVQQGGSYLDGYGRSMVQPVHVMNPIVGGEGMNPYGSGSIVDGNVVASSTNPNGVIPARWGALPDAARGAAPPPQS
ncbi:hypothetical protein QJS10_CPA02g01398 [Acorus calamus]|uniref:Protein FLX-like 4 n=1 Tax=Acorus calamus TaxID=4465 RepID=A0AAV9FI03_ACOCL|nr:hypothetical protein QJS10_CPA02g01398 [Acorus calamus]